MNLFLIRSPFFIWEVCLSRVMHALLDHIFCGITDVTPPVERKKKIR